MSQPPSQSSSLTETGAVRKDGVLPADELAEEATEGVTAGGEGSGSLGEEDSGDGAYTAATTGDLIHCSRHAELIHSILLLIYFY